MNERKMREGREAQDLNEPQTAEEARKVLDQLYSAVVAMQSLDDLGSPEANAEAWDNMCALNQRYERIKAKWFPEDKR